MPYSKFFSALLLGLALTACGGDDSDSTAVDTGANTDSAAVTASAAPGYAPGSNEDDLPPSYDFIQARFGDLDVMQEHRSIRILTVYSIGRYYVDGVVEKGLVRETASLFEEFINKRLNRGRDKIHVVLLPVARSQLIPSLLAGRGDIIAASMTITDERSRDISFSSPISKPLSEVLITGPRAPAIETLEDLSGQAVYLRHSSSYRESVEAVNQRFAEQGLEPIHIQPVSEFLEDADLVEMVNAGMLEWAIVDDYKLPWWEDVFSNIQVRRDIVFRSGSRIGWAFRNDSPQLEAAINDFMKKHREGTLIGNVLKNRYFRDFDWATNALHSEDYQRFTELRHLFEKYGDKFDMDALMIAAQGYQESRLDQSARSSAGAVGVMQIKPSTARDKNVNVTDIHQVDPNIHAGTKYLNFIRERYFSDPAIDERNQVLLSLAAYNMGPGRMLKLREQASGLGYDPNVWFDNVELAAARYVGREPVQYVANIFKYYLAYKLSTEQWDKRQMARQRAEIGGPG